MKTLVLLAILWAGPSEKFETTEMFLKSQHTTIRSLCRKYHAKDCVVSKTFNETDELGFTPEIRTASWALYGRKK